MTYPYRKIMLIGEAPGGDEEKRGLPFVGKAGKVLDECLQEAGLSRADCYVTNVVKCRPPRNRTPEDAEMMACSPYLLEEIEAVQPQIIVALGGTALKMLTGKDGITKERGRTLLPRKGLRIAAPITGTFHPAATFRDPAWRAIIVEDLRAVARQTQHASPIVDSPSATEDVRLFAPPAQRSEIRAALDDLKAAAVLTCDLEWTAGPPGKDGKQRIQWPWTPGASAISMAIAGWPALEDRPVAIALPVPLPEDLRAAVTELLTSAPTIMHNTLGDMTWLWSLGIDVLLGGDTMFLGHIIDETKSKALSAMSEMYAPDKVTPGWKNRAQHLMTRRPQSLAEWLQVLSYNAEDALMTLHLFYGLIDWVKKYNVPHERSRILRVHKMMIDAVPAFREAVITGMPINVARLNEEIMRAQKRQDAALEDLVQATGLAPRNALKLAGSSDQTAAFMHGQLGITIDQSRKDDLEPWRHFEPVDAILRVRKEIKRIGTYLQPWNTMVTRQGDGVLHSMYRLTGTRTGRVSAESELGGPILVAPRNDDDVQFRSLIEAPDGEVLVMGDYSQLELRVIAWVAHERTMLDIYRSSTEADLHRTLAAYLIAMRGNPNLSIQTFLQMREQFESAVTKVERQNAKGGNFGLAYGMKEAKLQAYCKQNYGVDLTMEQTQVMYRGYFTLFGDIPPWQQYLMRETATRGYTQTVFGRRRMFADANDVHAAINTPVQSTGSDITQLAMAQLWTALQRERLPVRVGAFVHDAIILRAPEAHAERARDLLVYHMENVDTSMFGIKIDVPLLVEGKIAKVWE